MKNTKLVRIFVLILSLALLAGSAFALSASAEEGEAYEIKSINISHSDAIQVLIAVDAPINEEDLPYAPDEMPAPEIDVTYTIDTKDGPKTRNAIYWYYVDIYSEGIYYPVYYTAGIAIKDCGEQILAEAHTAGLAPAEPAYKDACVAEYLYEKLYKEDYISKTEGEDAVRKEFYLEMINYISSAQQVLWNDKEENADAPRTLVKDRTYLSVTDGEISGVGKGGFVTGESAEITYSGTNAQFAGWQITTCVDGVVSTSVVSGKTVPLTSSAKLTPYIDTAMITFDDLDENTGWIVTATDLDSSGKYTKGETAVEKSQVSLPSALVPAIDLDNYFGTAGNEVAVKIDENGNHYLKYVSVGKDLMDTTSEYNNYSRIMSLTFNTSTADIPEGANTSVIEMDMKLNMSGFGWGQSFAPLYFHGSSGKTVGNETSSGITINLFMTATKMFAVQIEDVVYEIAPADEWFRFKVEFCYDTDGTGKAINFYADDVLKKSLDVSGVSFKGPLKDMQFAPSAANKFDVDIDRLSIKHIVK